jgi:hypothetical protein
MWGIKRHLVHSFLRGKGRNGIFPIASILPYTIRNEIETFVYKKWYLGLVTHSRCDKALLCSIFFFSGLLLNADFKQRRQSECS